MLKKNQREDTKEMAPPQKQELAGAETTRSGRMFTPAVDILETESAITMLADMPGVELDGLTIDLHENVLSIDGIVAAEDRHNEQVLLREYDTGSFHREFKLSNLVDQDRIDATMRDGVLRLTLPKAEKARPRKVKVRAG